MKKLVPCLLMLLQLSTYPLLAAASDKDVIEDQVSFQVEVERDVENDRALATLSVTAEDRDPARLAQQINEKMGWALDQLKGLAAIQSRSGSYQTYPVYDERKIVRWRGTQELQLESGDIDRLARFIGTLQERLQVQSMQFLVSAAKRRDVESTLTEEALAAFQQRAEVIRKSLGASGYRLMDVSVHTGGLRPPVPLRAEAMSVSRAPVASPAVEQGTSSVSVQVSGRIQLVRK
jgi:predicted secreted protein